MALFMQQWVEVRNWDIVIEADSEDEAKKIFDKLDHSNERCKGLGCYDDFIWRIAAMNDSEVECSGVAYASPFYTQPDLTADQIKQFIGE